MQLVLASYHRRGNHRTVPRAGSRSQYAFRTISPITSPHTHSRKRPSHLRTARVIHQYRRSKTPPRSPYSPNITFHRLVTPNEALHPQIGPRDQRYSMVVSGFEKYIRQPLPNPTHLRSRDTHHSQNVQIFDKRLAKSFHQYLNHQHTLIANLPPNPPPLHPRLSPPHKPPHSNIFLPHPTLHPLISPPNNYLLPLYSPSTLQHSIPHAQHPQCLIQSDRPLALSGS